MTNEQELKDHIITEHFIMCFATDCNNEVRDTDESWLAKVADIDGFVVRDGETFCAEHADLN